MKSILKLGVMVLVCTACVTGLWAQKAPEPEVAKNEASRTIKLSESVKSDQVIPAMVKAFTDLGWTEVTVAGDTIRASLECRGIKVKASAVCSASEVKIVALYEPGKQPDEKAKGHVQHWLRKVEKNVKPTLGMASLPTKKARKTAAENK